MCLLWLFFAACFDQGVGAAEFFGALALDGEAEAVEAGSVYGELEASRESFFEGVVSFFRFGS